MTILFDDKVRNYADRWWLYLSCMLQFNDSGSALQSESTGQSACRDAFSWLSLSLETSNG